MKSAQATEVENFIQHKIARIHTIPDKRWLNIMYSEIIENLPSVEYLTSFRKFFMQSVAHNSRWIVSLLCDRVSCVQLAKHCLVYKLAGSMLVEWQEKWEYNWNCLHASYYV